jgi:endonuclease YncB( thermonuclease family)
MVLLTAFAPLAKAGLTGVVVDVPAGDKLTVLADERVLTLRLGDIDAPEPGQPFSARAVQSLARLCLAKPVTVDEIGIDKPRGVFGHVLCGDVDAGAEQVRRGMAWVYVEAPPDSSLRSLQAEAQAAGSGLWSGSDPTPPWVWRREDRQVN